jgi:predicted metalloprotease with PDZ domain
VQNIGGLRFELPDGTVLTWRRDDVDMCRFHVDVPAGETTLVAKLDYIANQPSTNTIGIDTYGNSLLGVINWNTCLLYPDGANVKELLVNLSVRLPEGWKHATALETQGKADNAIQFRVTSFYEVVDSPLLCGEHLRTVPLEQNFKPVYLHLASESPEAINLKEDLITAYGRVVAEAGAMFGSAPFDTYHFLVTCSNDLPPNGLEHLKSSLNGVSERGLIDEESIKGWNGYLLPHEFAHAWCGKYRRPVGMVTTDYHTPCKTDLLWIYEGLTQYLGEVLCVRSGLWDLDHVKQVQAAELAFLQAQTGRQWRSLEDTAIDSANLRERSRHWSGLRRSQDYYVEGRFLWLEVDAMIRGMTKNKKSLDDFCRSFFAYDPQRAPTFAYTFDEVCDELNEVASYDWGAFFKSRVEKPLDVLPTELAGKLGYRLEYVSEAPGFITKREKERGYVMALATLGMDVGNDGTVYGNLIPDMPADRGGLAPGMKIVAVNSRKFSADRLREAIKNTPSRGSIDFLILDGDVFRSEIVVYSGGQKYLQLIRDESKPDLLKGIYSGRTTRRY